MKRISKLGPVPVIHNGQHFEMRPRQPRCHGYDKACHCDGCKNRAALQKRERTALPWEEDYKAA